MYTYTMQVLDEKGDAKGSATTVCSASHKDIESIWDSQKSFFSANTRVEITDNETGCSKICCKAIKEMERE